MPGITDLPPETFIILQVAPHTPKKKHGVWNVRRQWVGGFVGGAGHNNPKTCDEASLFGVRSGQLLSGGQPIATNPGVAFTTFKAMPAGRISRIFAILNGYLHWFNEQFTGGEAEFCQVPDGTVYITFRGDNSGPANCQRVDIVTYFGTSYPLPLLEVAFFVSSTNTSKPSQPANAWTARSSPALSLPESPPALRAAPGPVSGGPLVRAPTFLPGRDEL
ncbi:hypothetical protein F4824DRAFT_96598 [Ustulina deusta]|nr:hypothetical protein F4824DRAFT_96598 [Ustulina deusta]